MRYKRKEIPQFNSSSMADIAFLLLIFFLITSSLESKTGIYRQLSPGFAEDILKKKSDIQERNFLFIEISENNQLILGEEIISIPEIKTIAKTFIANPENLDYLPEKESIDLPIIGNYPVSNQHIIQLEVNRNSNYQTYISVISELTAAYNELRNEFAQNHFRKTFDKLTDEEKEVAREVYPLRITEKERKEESDE